MGSSMIACGASIASYLLMIVAPANPVTAGARIASSGLSIADVGISMYTVRKKNHLLCKADKICKTDYQKHFDSSWYPIFNMLLRSLNYMDESLTVLKDLESFLSSSFQLHKGNFCSVAEELKGHYKTLKTEYKSVKQEYKSGYHCK